MLHPVERLPDDRHRQRPLSDQRTQPRNVGVGAEYPRRIPHAVARGCFPGQPKHVGFGIHADDRAGPGGERNGELSGSASEVEDDVVRGHCEGCLQRVEYLRRVTTPKLRVVRGSVTTESQSHGLTLPSAVPARHLLCGLIATS